MNYWAVGASFEGKDVSDSFIKESVWYDGYAANDNNQNERYLNQVEIGDIIIMKSSSTKGKNHSITFTKLKGIGIVISKNSWFSFNVNWLKNDSLPKDFDGISYRKTIEFMRQDKMFEYVVNYMNILNKNERMKEINNLLKLKHQIILQGAPGTGKTFTAKEVAKQLTKPVKLGSPLLIINEFFKSFNPDKETIKFRKKQNTLLETFQKEFPKDKLKEIELDNYVLGFGSQTFSWWIEYGLEHLGKYTGPATKFKIYWSKSKEEFRKSAFLKNHDDDTAIKMIGEQLHTIAENINPEKTIKYLSKGLVLKILHSYHPDIYFPISKEEFIDNVLKLFDISPEGISLLEKNKKVQDLFLQKKKEYSVDITNFEFMFFLFDKFDLKVPVKIEKNQILTNGEYKVIQFHPAYTYEDFVRGITVETDDENRIQYSVKNKVLAKFAQKALDSPKANFVLIIDEINRANLPAVLGELIYALEYRYDENNPEETTVESMYALYDDDDDDNPESKQITLPKNLFIIGTMNTADRSVGHIDYAIRRRFAFVNINPDKTIIETEKGQNLFIKMTELFCNDYENNKDNPERSLHLSQEFNPLDVMVGHSYFMGEEKNLNMRLEYEIKPILNEYLKDGVLLESAKEIIEKLSV
ncbi:MAG: AAA family ATPase [Bacteroidales bacterium]|nr:AAA family ATPase [Bacteroidales bacterium]